MWPKDINGEDIYPFSVVKILSIPKFYYENGGDISLKEYEGCFGIVTYQSVKLNDLYIINWSDDNGSIFVDAIKLNEEYVGRYDFSIKASDVKIIKSQEITRSMFMNVPFNCFEVNSEARDKKISEIDTDKDIIEVDLYARGSRFYEIVRDVLSKTEE